MYAPPQPETHATRDAHELQRPNRIFATKPARVRSILSNDCSRIALTRMEDFRLKSDGLVRQSRHGSHASESQKNSYQEIFDACERHKNATSQRGRLSRKEGGTRKLTLNKCAAHILYAARINLLRNTCDTHPKSYRIGSKKPRYSRRTYIRVRTVLAFCVARRTMVSATSERVSRGRKRAQCSNKNPGGGPPCSSEETPAPLAAAATSRQR